MQCQPVYFLDNTIIKLFGEQVLRAAARTQSKTKTCCTTAKRPDQSQGTYLLHRLMVMANGAVVAGSAGHWLMLLLMLLEWPHRTFAMRAHLEMTWLPEAASYS
jgi:hypothetical protein